MFLSYAKLRAIEVYWNQAADRSLLPNIKLFWKIKRGLELVSLTHFLYSFWRKLFLLLNYIDWPSFTVWLPLLREILSNTSTATVCWQGCGVMNFVINVVYLIKPFFYVAKKSWQKLKCLENEISFYDEIKSIFHYF